MSDGKVHCKCPKGRPLSEGGENKARTQVMNAVWNKSNQLKEKNTWTEEDHRSHLEQELKTIFNDTAFNICETQPLQQMRVEPMKVTIKDNTKDTVNRSKPYPIPIHLKDKIRRLLEMQVALGIIEPIPRSQLTDWCAPMLAVPKKNGTVRQVINFKGLNNNANRVPHPTVDMFRLAADIPGTGVWLV